MIGSITEQRDQLLALERRRQEIAAQAPVPPATTAPVAASLSGAPVAGSGPAPMALKAAEPDVTKRGKGKERGKRKDRDLRAEPAGTAAVAEGARAVMEAETAGKSVSERGAEPGPGEGVMPGHPEPEQFGRAYLKAGHASPSPQSEGPRANPMPQMQHYVPPDAPMAATIPPHVIEHYTMGSPSDR